MCANPIYFNGNGSQVWYIRLQPLGNLTGIQCLDPNFLSPLPEAQVMPKKSDPGFSTGPSANTLITYSFLHHNNSQGYIWTFNPKHYRFASCLPALPPAILNPAAVITFYRLQFCISKISCMAWNSRNSGILQLRSNAIILLPYCLLCPSSTFICASQSEQ